jgi:DNA-binding transcriptional ArsR family regulator
VVTDGHPLDALGDPTRRQVFELLRGGPHSVGELAAALPVSRPAVSQHLRVLEDAGLVTHRKEGTRNLYGLNGHGVAELRAWIDEFWDEALARFEDAVDASGKGGKS